MRNFRDVQAAEAQELLFELGQRQVQEAAAREEIEKVAATPQTQPTPVQRPPESARQQVDPLAAERAAVARAYQEAAAIQHMSEAEASLHLNIKNHDAWARQNFPELNDSSGRALLELRETNPQRLALIAENYQRNKQARTQLQALQTNRVAAQSQIAQRQREQIFERADSEFNVWLKATHPAYASGARRSELQRTVAKYLKEEVGLSDAQIQHGYRVSGELRGLAQQKTLADAAMWRIAQQNARNVRSKAVHAPPVQRPGIARPSGADAEDSIRSLQRELEGATGERALRLATKLTQLRRAL